MRASLHFTIPATVIAIFAMGPLLAPQNPLEQHREFANSPPTTLHWLGTDDYGRDVFSRFLAGASWSILTGIAATSLVLILGFALGGIAGFRGGWADRLCMRVAELFLALPWLYLLIGLRAVLPLNMSPRTAVASMLFLMALVSWARPARLVRGVTLSLSQRGYVEAARGFGVPEWKIFVRHVLPGTYRLAAAQALILFPRFVLAEVTLSFLGLGTGEPDPSWGALILGLKQAYLLPEQWWRILPVALMIPLFVLCAHSARVAVERFGAAR
jgi:peptide/nickel transport system permease protein